MACSFSFLQLLSFATALLLTQLSLSSTQKIPSYAKTMAKVPLLTHAARLKAANPAGFTRLRDSFPLLSSPALFQHELMKAAELLAGEELGLVQETNASSACADNLAETLTGVVERTGWALQMIDAMGKPLPDLEGGNLIWVGAYSQCLGIRAWNFSTDNSSASNSTDASLLFRGQYCTANIPLAQSFLGMPYPMALSVGLCVPDSCSGADLASIINFMLKKMNVSMLDSKPATVACSDPHKPLDGLAIAGIAVVSVFAALMLVGTLTDLAFKLLVRWKGKRVDLMSNNFHSNQDDDILLLGSPSTIPEPGLVAKLLIAFSVYTNGAKLLSTEQSAGTLGCVHGVRFLSMTWVVLGHTFMMPFGVGANMLGYAMEVLPRWTFQAISNASVSVDSFFVLSGLLVSYLSLKELARTGGKINWFKFYFHRFWRLTPPYMLIIFVYLSLGRYWGSGPQWKDQQADRDNCRESWWTNLLYINNYVHTDKVCLGQSWYLANDMQFYVLSPLIFVPLFYSPVYGVASALTFLLATIVTPAALTMKYHIPPGFLARTDATPIQSFAEKNFYFSSYNRMGPYIIGMLAGYLLYITDCKVKLNKAVNLLCWAVAAASALAVLYGLYNASNLHPVPLSLPVAALYNAVNRTVWGAAVSWVVFACVTGNGGFINTILSWKALIPLSRLTYCIYLLHIMVISSYLLCRDSVFYYSDANVVMLFLGGLVACYMLSVVVSLAFEAPMMALEKAVLGRSKRD